MLCGQGLSLLPVSSSRACSSRPNISDGELACHTACGGCHPGGDLHWYCGSEEEQRLSEVVQRLQPTQTRMRDKAGRGDCDKKIWRNGCETNIKNDAKNCGSCGKPCKQVGNAVTSCLNGKCRNPVCKSGYANCDKNIWRNGCETRVAKDVNNCGACSNVCKQVANAVTSCQNGKCGTPVCKAGWSNCDANRGNGCETPTSEDPANCGACSNVCTQYPNAVTPCRPGTCDYGSITCKAGFNNCNSPVMAPDGCETENLSDANNCGACYNVCPRTLEGSEVSCR
ncbi:hypothetical protein M758_10G015000 [Ceratodon purpureus]|nr:hypothetical protein M758_10G015000 [Ceratodon purpureus]